MVTSQPHRSGTVQAWWAHTGSTNRGFVSLDPERQREVDSGWPPSKKHLGNELAFGVRPAGTRGRPGVPGRGAPKAPKPTPPVDSNPAEPRAGEEPDGERGRRR